MKPKEIIACYVTRSYPSDRPGFRQHVADFESATRALGESWARRDETAERVVFRRGARLKFSFRYERGEFEVQVIFTHNPATGEMTVSVGNWGFPFESWLARRRYQRELDRIDAWFAAVDRYRPAPRPLGHSKHHRFAPRLAQLVQEFPEQEEAMRCLYQLITDVGSETPDNVHSVGRLAVVETDGYRGIGLRSGRLLSDVLNAAENHGMPAGLRAEMPTLAEDDWSAALRLCTLLLVDLELRTACPESAAS